MKLKGKIAVITGGASGIGKEIVLLFEEHGAQVIVFDQQETPGGICVDITEENAVKSAFDKVVKEFGKVDILVNNAGIFAPGKTNETSFDQWQKVLSVNLDGAFLCSKYAVNTMLSGSPGGGVIINIASEAGLVAIHGQVAYNVSKAAMIHLSNCMAVDYALDNIRVNCICPGRVLTPMVQNIIDNSDEPEKTKSELSHDRPLMQMGNPKDIAYACLHFADGSMPYATGAVLAIDGGYTTR